jgi:hypothetical protein
MEVSAPLQARTSLAHQSITDKIQGTGYLPGYLPGSHLCENNVRQLVLHTNSLLGFRSSGKASECSQLTNRDTKLGLREGWADHATGWLSVLCDDFHSPAAFRWVHGSAPQLRVRHSLTLMAAS